MKIPYLIELDLGRVEQLDGSITISAAEAVIVVVPDPMSPSGTAFRVLNSAGMGPIEVSTVVSGVGNGPKPS